MLVQLDHRCLLLGWPYIFYKYARVDACQKPGRGWQRDDTKGLIVLAGDSRGLHGRWPGNGYFYRRIRAYTFQWPPGNSKAREEVSYTSH